MRLSEFPTGERIVLDTNCLVYHFTGAYASCAVLLDRIRRREVHAVTSTIVWSELHHRLMMLEASQRLGRPLRQMPSFLKRHPDAIRPLTSCDAAMAYLRRLPIRVLPVTSRLMHEAIRLAHQLGLLTNDAVLVVTMRRHGLVHLASNDRDFARVPGITVWRP